MFRFRQLIYLLLFLQLQSVVCSDTVMYRMIDRWKFEDFKIEGLTLGKAIEKFRINSGPKDRPEYRTNVVVKWSQLTDVQKKAKITMDGTGHKSSDVIHVLAMTLGLGYKIEEYAVIIGSRANYPLPKTKSTELGPMLESIRTEPKILIRYVDK